MNIRTTNNIIVFTPSVGSELLCMYLATLVSMLSTALTDKRKEKWSLTCLSGYLLQPVIMALILLHSSQIKSWIHRSPDIQTCYVFCSLPSASCNVPLASIFSLSFFSLPTDLVDILNNSNITNRDLGVTVYPQNIEYHVSLLSISCLLARGTTFRRWLQVCSFQKIKRLLFPRQRISAAPLIIGNYLLYVSCRGRATCTDDSSRFRNWFPFHLQ